MNTATAQSDRELFEEPGRPLGSVLTAALIGIGPIAGLVAAAIALSVGAPLGATITRVATLTLVAGVGPIILLWTANGSPEGRAVRLQGRQALILAAPLLVLIPMMLVAFVANSPHTAAPAGQVAIQVLASLAPVSFSILLCRYGFGVAAADGNPVLLVQQMVRVRKLASHGAKVAEHVAFGVALLAIVVVILAMVFGAARPEHGDLVAGLLIIAVGISGIGSIVLVQISGARRLRGHLVSAR